MTLPIAIKAFQPGLLVISGLRQIALIVAFSLALTSAVIAQNEPAKPNKIEEEKAEKKDEDKPAQDPKLPFTLTITDDQIIGISLRAKEISVKQIAAELSKRLKIPVLLTPIVEKHLVTVNFSDLVLEPAMQMLAPQVYIDYVIDTTTGHQPRAVAIYLQGYNERPPADNATVKSNSDIIVIEGNTEEGVNDTDDEEGDLKITFENGELSVKSKKQPLIVVLYGIANQLGIPMEVKNEVTDLVTVDINKSPVESVIQQLGPNIRFYMRADLMVGQRRPLRLVLVGPEKKS